MRQEKGPGLLQPGPDTPTAKALSTGTDADARTSSSIPETVRQLLTYCDSCSKRAIADGLNPLTIGHMPSDNSQKNSGMVAMACTTPPASMTPSSTPTPEAMIRGPPTRTGSDSEHDHGEVPALHRRRVD
jgi:hypothetical protein